MAERIPRPGEFYRHFKNKLYQIVAVAEHSETGEAMVVYQALYGDFKIYVRPFSLFVDEVDKNKYPRVTQKYRFEQVPTPNAAPVGELRPIRYIGRDTKEQEMSERKPKVWTIPRSAKSAFAAQEEEKQSRIAAWKEVEAERILPVSDGEDYEEARSLSAEERIVIPREGRAEKKEDDLWESLTDEAMQAVKEQEENTEADGETVNPKFLDFLEARTYESKAVILESMKEDLDDEMIDGLAMAVDMEIPKGPIEERYHQLEHCLRTMARYEDGRLR